MFNWHPLVHPHGDSVVILIFSLYCNQCPEALSARLSEKDASLASLQAWSFENNFTANRCQPSSHLPFWRFFVNVFVGLGFGLQNPKTCQHWCLRPTKCFVAAVACGTLWGQQPSSKNYSNRILKIVWLGDHFLNAQTRYYSVWGVCKSTKLCPSSCFWAQRGRTQDQMWQPVWCRNHSIQVENRISFTMFCHYVFLEMVEAKRTRKSRIVKISDDVREYENLGTFHPPNQASGQPRKSKRVKTCSNTSEVSHHCTFHSPCHGEPGDVCWLCLLRAVVLWGGLWDIWLLLIRRWKQRYVTCRSLTWRHFTPQSV